MGKQVFKFLMIPQTFRRLKYGVDRSRMATRGVNDGTAREK